MEDYHMKRILIFILLGILIVFFAFPDATTTAQVSAEKTRIPRAAGHDMVVSINGPTETAVGRQIMFTPDVSGATGKLTYEWVAFGKKFRQYRLSAHFTKPITEPKNITISLKVWDQGRYQAKPKEATKTITVYSKLKGGIQGPLVGEPNERLNFRAVPYGGKPRYTCLWTKLSGPVVHGETLKETLTGMPGQRVVIRLRVTDSLLPPQELYLTKEVTVKASALAPPTPAQAPNISGNWRYGDFGHANITYASMQDVKTDRRWYNPSDNGKYVKMDLTWDKPSDRGLYVIKGNIKWDRDSATGRINRGLIRGYWWCNLLHGKPDGGNGDFVAEVKANGNVIEVLPGTADNVKNEEKHGWVGLKMQR